MEVLNLGLFNKRSLYYRTRSSKKWVEQIQGLGHKSRNKQYIKTFILFPKKLSIECC